MSRSERICRRISDAVLDIMYRPLGIRRERVGDKIIYTFPKHRQPIRTERIETKTEIQFIDYYEEEGVAPEKDEPGSE